MEYFREKQGAYIFAGGSLGTARKVVTFGLVTSGTMSRKEAPTASIRCITLSRAGGSIYRQELSGGGYWAVGMETGDGSFQLVTLRDHDAAAGVARELSGLISVPFSDRQN